MFASTQKMIEINQLQKRGYFISKLKPGGSSFNDEQLFNGVFMSWANLGLHRWLQPIIGFSAERITRTYRFQKAIQFFKGYMVAIERNIRLASIVLLAFPDAFCNTTVQLWLNYIK